MKSAKQLYNAISQQKSVFLHALTNVNTGDCIRLTSTVKTFRERLITALFNYKGPIVTVRDIQKHLKNVRAENIKLELNTLQQQGFGSVKITQRKQLVFLKPMPEDVSLDNKILKESGLSIDYYRMKFEDISQMSQNLISTCINHHPNAEVLMDKFPSPDNVLTQNNESNIINPTFPI